MTETLDSTAAPSFPMARECPFAPPAEYRQIREEERISKVTLATGVEAWVVTRHQDVRAVLTDHRHFSSDRLHPDFPTQVPNAARTTDTRSMIAMDAPEHGPARRAVLGEFTVRRMEALRPRIQEIVDQRIDALLSAPKPADLVEMLSLPVPSLVICELLGVPYEDHDHFQGHTSKFLKREASVEERQAAFGAVRKYLDELITRKEAEPTEDLLGRQIVKRREEGTYDHAEMVELGILLLVAGHETTANMISLGTVALLEHPEQLAAIKADPGKTLDAVEELLRYSSIVDGIPRLCVEDTEIGGVTIRAGEGVLALAYSANRAPDPFENPDTLDIERGGRHHVAFGFGPHQCLGQNLARMELQIVFDTLFARVPTLKLAAGLDDLPFKDDALIYGLYRLPVTW
ncbi:cytochrome P450 [Amycolatopsis sp. NPDC059021]|uniref:cytochrome P450 n=1 Tax=Amycolatopsis sp. NPDC059021 TaxID=3346704 RepID=UPI003670C311